MEGEEEGGKEGEEGSLEIQKEIGSGHDTTCTCTFLQLSGTNHVSCLIWSPVTRDTILGIPVLTMNRIALKQKCARE